MRKTQKNRPRLLVISQTPHIRNDLVTLLSGYGYYVDYVSDRRAGLRAYRRHKHMIAIFDVAALPRFPNRLFRLFRTYNHTPTIMIAATADEEPQIYKYLDKGVYDIVQLPLKVDYLHFALRRMVQHNRLEGQVYFYRLLLIMFFLMIPVWFLLVFLLSRFG